MLLLESCKHLQIRLRGGGRLELPLNLVKRVESRSSAGEDYAERVRQTDMNAPASIERLALWASGRGMGRRATHLLDMARGLRLEHKIETARRSGRVTDYVDTFHWARSAGLADEVLVWILDQAGKLEEKDKTPLKSFDSERLPREIEKRGLG